MRTGSRKFFFLSFRSLFFGFYFSVFGLAVRPVMEGVTVCLLPLSDVLARVGLAISGVVTDSSGVVLCVAGILLYNSGVGMASSRVGIDGSGVLLDGSGITLHIAGIILHSSRPEMLS